MLLFNDNYFKKSIALVIETSHIILWTKGRNWEKNAIEKW